MLTYRVLDARASHSVYPLNASMLAQPRSLLHPKYRPDVDGLRAVAVTSVIGFHAFPSWAHGGFIGVDIFFVISGYLISSILFSNLEQGSFSIIEFYNRRIRRIFPALIVVFGALLIVGWFGLLADDYRQLGKHLGGGAAFVSNFLFWSEIGYFDKGTATKPLLHLWSLGIEEQFYVLWPLMLAFVWRQRWNFLLITAALAAVSFCVNVYLTGRYPAAAFYSPASRFWELMVGGSLAYITIHRPSWNGTFGNVKSIAGFCLLALGYALIDHTSSFPGWWALLPTLGSFLIIWAGPDAYLNRRLLSFRLLVWIGLISYPLYLWHWPLLALARVVSGTVVRPDVVFLLLVACVVLSWGTYKLVERPVRSAQWRMTPIVLLAFMLGLGIAGIVLYATNGVPGRTVNANVDYMGSMNLIRGVNRPDESCMTMNGLQTVSEEICHSNSRNPEVLILGDSHAISLYSAIYANGFSVPALLIGSHSCALYPGLHYTPPSGQNWGNNCTAIAEASVEAAARIKSVKTVILAYAYPAGDLSLTSMFDADGRKLTRQEAFVSGNAGMIRRLTALGKTVVFLIDNPELRFDPRYCSGWLSIQDGKPCSPTLEEHQSRQKGYLIALADLKRTMPDLKTIDPTEYFCGGGTCKYSEGGKDLYFDEHHLSITGSAKVLQLMRNQGLF